jgi:hypothetical protein
MRGLFNTREVNLNFYHLLGQGSLTSVRGQKGRLEIFLDFPRLFQNIRNNEYDP